jgi:hypothetical protein
MTDLRQSAREALKTVATSTLTGSLHKRGLRNMFLQDSNRCASTRLEWSASPTPCASSPSERI